MQSVFYWQVMGICRKQGQKLMKNVYISDAPYETSLVQKLQISLEWCAGITAIDINVHN